MYLIFKGCPNAPNLKFKSYDDGQDSKKAEKGIPFYIGRSNGESILRKQSNIFREATEKEIVESQKGAIERISNKEIKFKKVSILKTLFVLDKSLGDTLLSLPAIYSYRKSYPSNKIDIVCSKENSFLVESIADNILDIEDYEIGKIKIANYDDNKILKGEGKYHNSSQSCDRIQVFCNVAKVPFKISDIKESIELTGIEKGNGSKIGIQLNSASTKRTWDGSFEKVKELTNKLIGEGYKVVWFSDERISYNRKGLSNLTGKLDTKEFVFEVLRTKFLICCGDSSGYHIAGLYGIPFIAMFGVVRPDQRCRYYKNYYAFYKKNCIKSPCERKTSDCITCKCLESIEVDEVIEQFIKLYGEVYGQK